MYALSGGGTDDHLGGDVNDLVCLGRICHTVQQECGQFLAEGDFIHIKGSEQGCELLDLGTVIKSNDLYILGNVDFSAFHGSHQIQCDGIIGCNEAIRKGRKLPDRFR